VLRPPLFRGRSRRRAGLREARRGVRSARTAGEASRRVALGAARRTAHAGCRRHRRPRHAGRERLPDGAARRGAEGDGAAMSRTIVIEVENRPGELARIVNLFAARGVNIDTLTVEATALGDPSDAISQITVTTDASARTCEQIVRFLNRQV